MQGADPVAKGRGQAFDDQHGGARPGNFLNNDKRIFGTAAARDGNDGKAAARVAKGDAGRGHGLRHDQSGDQNRCAECRDECSPPAYDYHGPIIGA